MKFMIFKIQQFRTQKPFKVSIGFRTLIKWYENCNDTHTVVPSDYEISLLCAPLCWKCLYAVKCTLSIVAIFNNDSSQVARAVLHVLIQIHFLHRICPKYGENQLKNWIRLEQFFFHRHFSSFSMVLLIVFNPDVHHIVINFNWKVDLRGWSDWSLSVFQFPHQPRRFLYFFFILTFSRVPPSG